MTESVEYAKGESSELSDQAEQNDMMMALRVFNEWNGYLTLEETLESGTLYDLGMFPYARSSYDRIADAMAVAEETAVMLVSNGGLHFVLEYQGQQVEVTNLDEALSKIGL